MESLNAQYIIENKIYDGQIIVEGKIRGTFHCNDGSQTWVMLDRNGKWKPARGKGHIKIITH